MYTKEWVRIGKKHYQVGEIPYSNEYMEDNGWWAHPHYGPEYFCKILCKDVGLCGLITQEWTIGE
jgi:hypothetical protein